MELETTKLNDLTVTYRLRAYDIPLLKHEIVDNIYGIEEGMKVIIDIGAHLGGTALKAASLGVKVFSYEPEENSFMLLNKNLRDNDFYDEVETFRLAVGEPGNGFLYLHENNMGAHNIYATSRDQAQPIKIISVNDIFYYNEIEHCDLLKLDCEYAETYILSDISDVNLAKVDRIAVELHRSQDRDHKSPIMERLLRDFKITSQHKRDYIFVRKALCKD